MGVKIEGIGFNLLMIEGVNELKGIEYCFLFDMIEIGFFIGLAVMIQLDIIIKDVWIDQLGIIFIVFGCMGIKFDFEGDNICILQQDIYEI